MSKTMNIIDFIDAGIKAEGLRQKAIASNIANLRTPGYRRFDIKFKELLTKAMDSSGAVDFDKLQAQFYKPKKTPVQSNGNDVNLEAEVGEMMKNTIRHRAFVRLLSKKYKQIEMAISAK